jgi:hypothetical protein
MRNVFLLCTGLCVALAVPSQARAQDAECRAIIDKALQAQGGAEKIESLKAFIAKAKGNIRFMEMNLDFTLEAYAQLPTKSKALINLSINGMQIEIVQAFDGNKGWTSALGQVKDAEKEEVDEHNAMVHVESVTNLYALRKDKEFKLSPLGETKVGDTPVVGVQVTKKDKRDVSLYFDKKTHLLVKAEYRALDPFTKMEVAQEKLYSEYKDSLLPGAKMASKQIVNNDGKRFMEVELTEIRVVDRHDDSVFAKPQ